MSTHYSKGVITARHRIKKSLVFAYGNKCYVCHKTFNKSVYELHHLDPSKKSFSLGNGSTHALNITIKEAKKCILVCPTCHRLITLGEIKLPKNTKSNFNTYKFMLIYKYSININKERALHKLKKQQLKSRIPHIPLYKRVNRNKLKTQIRTMPFTKVGKYYGVTDNSIRKVCKHLNLPYKTSDIKKISDENWKYL